MCSDDCVEDKLHFVMTCPVYSLLRDMIKGVSFMFLMNLDDTEVLSFRLT